MLKLLPQQLRSFFLWIGIIFGCVLLGFFLSRNGLIAVDDIPRYAYSRWLLHMYGLSSYAANDLVEHAKWYGPLWDLFLGINTEYIFAFFHDPYWVRHAITLSLFPLTLILTFVLLRRAQVKSSTALLAVAMLYGCIRFGGHAIFSKDFPPAASYLLISIYLWIRLRREQRLLGALSLRWRTIAEISVISILPFLLRPPLLLHFGLVVAIVCLYAIADKDKPVWQRCLMPALPLIIGLCIYYISFPILWGKPISVWGTPISLFSHYKYYYGTWFYGIEYKPQGLPWWYALGWIPLFAHPLVLAALVTGLFLLLRRSIFSSGPTVNIPLPWKNISLTFTEWICYITTISWGTVLIMQPTLYADMRHILFLFPPLILMGALGLGSIREWLKWCIVAVLIIVGSYNYNIWRSYSYNYVPSFMKIQTISSFNGDHGRICYTKAMEYLRDNIPEETPVFSYESPQYKIIQQRFNESILYTNKPKINFQIYRSYRNKNKISLEHGKYIYLSLPKGRIAKYMLHDNSDAYREEHLLWEGKMPNNEVACMVLTYDVSLK